MWTKKSAQSVAINPPPEAPLEILPIRQLKMANLLNSIGHTIVIGLIDAFEYLLFLVFSLFRSFTNAAVAEGFTKRGIQINPKSPKSSDLIIHNPKTLARWAAYRTLGQGESYMEGWWDCENLEEMFNHIFVTKGYRNFFSRPVYRFINYVRFQFFNLQTPVRSWEVGEKHYDLGNQLFEAMLDKNMNYSCGYWKNATDLDQAQLDKMDLIARKLQLKPGMKVLDIGCGWGGLCKYLAEKYDVDVVGLTVSKEQAKYARERCGLPNKVHFMVVDYRDLATPENLKKFDRIVSVGMFEHVGHKNYATFFEIANKCLKDDGLFLLHTIGVGHLDIPMVEPWFNTYIFPNGILPMQSSITEATQGFFIIEDWHNMSYNYCLTLRAWLDNFKKKWHLLQKNYKEPEKFYRMWTYYLQLSSASFRSRKYQLWQVVLSKEGVPGGYNAPR